MAAPCSLGFASLEGLSSRSEMTIALIFFGIDREIGHADPFEGIGIADHRNGVGPPPIDVVDSLEGQGTFQVDLHDDL